MIPFHCRGCHQQIGVQSERELILAVCAEDLDGNTFAVGTVTIFEKTTFRHHMAKCHASNCWRPIPRAATAGQVATVGDFA